MADGHYSTADGWFQSARDRWIYRPGDRWRGEVWKDPTGGVRPYRASMGDFAQYCFTLESAQIWVEELVIEKELAQ